MSQTTWTGPLASGDKNAGVTGGPNIGLAVLSQTVLIDFDATLVQNGTVYLPYDSQIVDIIVDVLTQYDSATSATVSVGTASGGTQYASGVNAKTGIRVLPTFTAAQLAAMDDIGTNGTVVATVTSVGQPTAGQVRVTYRYVQTTAQD
tara:strand:+ start:53 stop:496 length:444 start_codon:yes stop_codon:yes gene_type:complete